VEPTIAAADMVVLSVNTPTKARGIGAGQAIDLRWIEASARQVAACAQGHTIVVEKSTLPVRTAEVISTILSAAKAESPSSRKSFAVLSNHEFLAEGTAISNLETPDRVLIGGEDPSAIEALAAIYGHWVLVVRRLFGTVTGKRIAVLGFAYGLRPTSSTRPKPTTPARPPPSASAATCWRKAPSWRSLIPR